MTSNESKNKLLPPKWLRVLIPTVLIAVWMTLAGLGGPFFGKISEVSSTDLTTFLPQNSESAIVSEKLADFRDNKTIPLIIVFESDDVLDVTQIKEIEAIGGELSSIDGVAEGISPPVVSDDRKAAYVLVPLDSSGDFKEIIPALRAELEGRDLVDWKLTGPASFARDLQVAFGGIDATLLLVALAVVFVILLVVYRSPLLPILVLIGSIAALAASILVIWYMAKTGIVQLNGQVQGILFILVIGAATDYSLLYIARYREELTRHKSAWAATLTSLKASIEPIVAAGATVTVGLMMLLLSDLGSNKALGPVGGIGIGFAVATALTFLPALLLPFGRIVFWPRQPQFDATSGGGKTPSLKNQHPIWSKVGNFVGRYPRRIWLITTAVLVVACVGFFQLKADGVSQSDFVLGYSEAREGQKMLDRHFPSGSGSPAYVLVDVVGIDKAVTVLDDDRGVDSVVVAAVGSPSGFMPIGEYATELRQSLITKTGFYPFDNASPKIINGKVLLQATLTDAADTLEARETIVRLRSSVSEAAAGSLIGGVTAVQYDTNQASIHDRVVLIPLILGAITLILILLLRSIVAPLILLVTTVISFGATLGVSALLFNYVWGFPGSDPSVVLFGFVFLVALGIDYNIFLMTRVREETLKHGVREGTIKGLVVTGGVITSAGIVLAATFAALGVIPILFLAQIAFIVAFGVLLDTIIVRSLLVPALTLDIGRVMWWPSRIGRKG